MGRIAITGSPRSGTHYTAACLNELGLEIGHERWSRDGCVDCFLPIKPQQPNPDDVIWHQTRHPLGVIGSLARAGFPGPKVADKIGWWPYEGGAKGSWLTVATRMRFWLDWTAVCDEYASWRYRVEDMPYWRFNTPLGQNSREHDRLSWGDLFDADETLALEVIARAENYRYIPNEWDNRVKEIVNERR
jgi:hypothetical protein